jgi:YidC/Oxa1 family membrane protein insertase
MFISLYNDIIYHPLLNLLVYFYNIIPGHDIGVVIVLLTILIRLILAPSFHKSLKSQKAMSDLQPKLNELK